MRKLPCPACGAELPFRSSVSVFAVCAYCGSMVVRHDMDLQALGKMAQLPADMSPLQLGAQGRYGKDRFVLVGRLKIAWEAGSWNEWYALFDDGRAGWLAEAQGFWMMSFAAAPPPDLPAVGAVRPGISLRLSGHRLFQVDDIKEATCVGSEGELPMKAAAGRKSTSVDLSGPGDEFACIDYAEDGARLYVGEYVEFDELRMSPLRQIDGW